MALGEAMKDITVSEEEAKEYYKANENQFMAGETVHAKHILVDDEDKCQEILSLIHIFLSKTIVSASAIASKYLPPLTTI